MSFNSDTYFDWKQNNLFKDLSQAQLDKLEPNIKKVTYSKNQYILRENEVDNKFYLIASGRVEILKEAEGYSIATLDAGKEFGTMAALGNQQKRSASVRALTEVELFVVDTEDLKKFSLLEQHDMVSRILRGYALGIENNLMSTNDYVVHSLKKLVLLSTAIIYLFVMIFCYTIALQYLSSLSQSIDATTYLSAVLLLLMVLISIAFIKTKKLKLREFGFNLNNWRFMVLDSIKWSIVFCIVITILKFLFIQYMPGFQHVKIFDIWSAKSGSIIATIIAVIAYNLLVPLQEFTARSMLQGIMQKILLIRHNVIAAIVISNIVFSLIHQFLGVNYMMIAFVAGLFWGWLYYRHDSLLGCCISHVIIGTWATVIINIPALFGS